jgi:hypothetical protein
VLRVEAAGRVTTWSPADPPDGWRFSDLAGAWQQYTADGNWIFSEPPPDAFVLTHGDQSAESDQRSVETDEPDAGQRLWSPTSLRSHGEEPWPTLDPAAFHGIAGRVVHTLEPHTEADPAGLLFSFLAAVGNIVGLGPHAVAEAMPHPVRLFTVLVGLTSKARKGSALAQIRGLLNLVDPTWTAACILPGLASGEALIAEVRDGSGDDLGAADKRRLVEEPEFARLLAVAGRQGSTLSHYIRDAWDGRRLKNRTKRDQQQATGAHISLVGHITREELLRRLDDTEIANGFANRFLFALVRRSKLLPEGGNLDPAALDDLAGQVGRAVERACRVGTLTRSPDAKDLWAKAYEDFGDGGEGLAAAVTARAEAQALRLSVAYAVLDGSLTIEVEHLEAALAAWRYCEESALLIFGDATGDPIADRLLSEIRKAGDEGLDGTRQRDLFGRHASGARLDQARAALEAKGLIISVQARTGGRPRLVSRAVSR